MSNGAKDWFCEIVVNGAKLKGIDISSVFDAEPAIAGCYGISGLGIDMEPFFKYFGGESEFIAHLDFCRERAAEICLPEQSQQALQHLLCWAIYILKGGRKSASVNIYNELPPEII